MARLSAAFILAFLLAASARAEWTVVTTQKQGEGAAGVEHRRVVLTESNTDERATLDLAEFSSKSSSLRVFANPEGKESLATVMRREHCVAGVNGGYFDVDGKPMGLLISDGKLLFPLLKARLLSGILIGSDSRIQLLRTAEYSSKRTATAARQSGPFLVDHGRPVPGLNNTRPARRTFVCTTNSDRAAIGFCSDVTLAELSKILITQGFAPDLRVQRALNLDGGSSSAFWFAGERGAYSISELKSVRDFVAILPK